MNTRKAIRRFYGLLGQPLYTRERIVLALLVPLLLASFLLPLWRISMEAPQYPEGLSMDIYPHTIVGGHGGSDIAEINILNHYIGMHRIDRAHLTDLGWLPFAIGALAVLTLRVAVVGNMRSLIDLAVITFYVCGFAFARFVYMLYTYGHELDPNAPVKVAGFTPALFGSKQIANFTTHSYPQLGAIFIALFAAAVAVIAVWHSLANRRRAKRTPEAVARPVAEEAPSPA
jgi:copper chaperone NosL